MLLKRFNSRFVPGFEITLLLWHVFPEKFLFSWIFFRFLWYKFFIFYFIAGEDIPPMQLKEGVFRCIMQLYDCLLTEVHERCKKGLSLAKRLNSSLAFFCYDLLSIIEPRQVFELVCLLLNFHHSELRAELGCHLKGACIAGSLSK